MVKIAPGGSSPGVSGAGLAMTAAGVIFTWSGVTGKHVTAVIKDILEGKNPANAPGTSLFSVNTGVAGVNQSNPITGNIGPISSSAAKNMAIGKMVAAKYGWSSGPEWDALVQLWNGESGWNNNAQNPTSTAFGIAQFLDTTWAGTGIGKSADPRIQIEAGLLYIKARYGSPSNAWAQWQARSPHWY